jgi:hypothetical protein
MNCSFSSGVVRLEKNALFVGRSDVDDVSVEPTFVVVLPFLLTEAVLLSVEYESADWSQTEK